MGKFKQYLSERLFKLGMQNMEKLSVMKTVPVRTDNVQPKTTIKRKWSK